MAPRITIQQQQEILDLRKAGLSYRKIANQVDVTRSTARVVVKRNRVIPPTPRKVPASSRISVDRQRQILEFYTLGWPSRQIATYLSVSKTTVLNVIHRNCVVVAPGNNDLWAGTKIKRCVVCGRLMKIKVDSGACIECKVIALKKRGLIPKLISNPTKNETPKPV